MWYFVVCRRDGSRGRECPPRPINRYWKTGSCRGSFFTLIIMVIMVFSLGPLSPAYPPRRRRLADAEQRATISNRHREAQGAM